jgi:Arc/MetJ family transcription regulator
LPISIALAPAEHVDAARSPRERKPPEHRRLAVQRRTAEATTARRRSTRVRWDSNDGEIGSMKTTIDIPDDELQDAMRFTGATTKREAVVTALRDFNRRHRMTRLVKHFGGSATFMTHEELMKLRRTP